MNDREYVEVEVERILRETDLAFLCLIDDCEEWIPKSQIEEPELFGDGDEDVILMMTRWIADQKGIET